MTAPHTEIERRLWDAADQLRANSKLKSSEYSVPVLGLIFLRYADYRFEQVDRQLKAAQTSARRPLPLSKARYQAAGVLYLPEEARFAQLLWLPEGADIGKAINGAIRAIEVENEDLKDVLPKTYNRLENGLLVALLKNFSSIPPMDGDAFGKIYEYFLGKFAMSEGQKGGEFFTPLSIVRLIVEIIEPFHGRILDPACGSGGMFVQSADFVKRHQKEPGQEISIYGQEKVAEMVRLCRMNLAVHGLSGDVKQGNTYYEDMHNLAGKFDFVMANPPFNVDKVDKERIKDDRARFPYGMPTADNANYLWIQQFYSALNAKLRQLIRLNKTRMNYLEAFQKLIADYNAGTSNIDELWAQLFGLTQALSAEEARHMVEQLSEEELALFDLLAQPDVTLAKAEQEQVKQLARDLLATLKRERLVLDWRKKQQARASIQVAIQERLADLPDVYDSDHYEQACTAVYQHIFENYASAVQSTYTRAA